MENHGAPPYSAGVAETLGNAAAIAGQMGHKYVGSEHLLCALAKNAESAAGFALAREGVGFRGLVLALKERFGAGTPTVLTDKDFSPRLKKLVASARGIAISRGDCSVEIEHLMLALLNDKACTAYSMLPAGSAARIYAGVCAKKYEPPRFSEIPPKTDSKPKKTAVKNEPVQLAKYAVELTSLAREGRLDPVIGRETEIERMVQILLRRNKNNPCLIGEAGVGKTAVVEGFAQRVAAENVPAELCGKRIYSVDIAAILSGAKYRGDFEERLKGVLDEASSNPDIILFIDEIHMIVGTGAAEGAIDAASVLKPLLARGKISLIGATTTKEYRRYIEKDSALERRFQPINVEQPDEARTIGILNGLRPRLEDYHKAFITDKAILAAVTLSERYMNDRRLPDKAIDLLDEAAAAARATRISDRNALFRSVKERFRGDRVIVDEENIAKAVSVITGIPVRRLSENESERLGRLEDRLCERVIGQDNAVSLVANAVRRGRAGLRDPKRPICSFLFLGQTGVGKTELCRAAAEAVFGDEKRLIRFDMSEFTERHSVSKLIGSPPGYVGSEQEGRLIAEVRSLPYSVVLFDEVEKAHPEVLNVLLQILEDGKLTGSDGRSADFKSTIIIMTGNIGAEELSGRSVGFGKTAKGAPDVMKVLRRTFRPELLNRIDNVVVFERITQENMEKICRKMLKNIAERALLRGIELSFDDNAVKKLCESALDEEMGARPLRRKITSQIEDMLGGRIISGELPDNSKAEVYAAENGFEVRILAGSRR